MQQKKQSSLQNKPSLFIKIKTTRDMAAHQFKYNRHYEMMYLGFAIIKKYREKKKKMRRAPVPVH